MIKDEGIITHWVKLNFPHHPQSLMDLLVDRICDAELDYKAEEISLQWNLDPISSS